LELEWDEVKRQWTLDNRRLDFADVQRFDHDSVITVPDLRKDYGEQRFNAYGYLHGDLTTYCFTWRVGRMRIISMRKANDRERKSYDSLKGSRHA
jgi:uncharacterized DUF497 family protein